MLFSLCFSVLSVLSIFFPNHREQRFVRSTLNGPFALLLETSWNQKKKTGRFTYMLFSDEI
ncbi:MAG: hypothetical protein KatS3mg034_2151 [Vicingaceae bacterium]|nr:MAG: hypothetical protein KatS3mg034_2151 [Vicingaceae bacterium]